MFWSTKSRASLRHKRVKMLCCTREGDGAGAQDGDFHSQGVTPIAGALVGLFHGKYENHSWMI